MAAVGIEPIHRDGYPMKDRDKDRRTLKNWWRRRNAKEAAAAAVAAVTSAKGPRSTAGVFSIYLEDSIAYASVPISYIDDSTGQQCYGYIPTIVAKCGSYLKDQGVYTEGVFRLSGSAKRIRDLQYIFDSPPSYGSQLDWKGYSVHDAANVLRRYLNYLPDPLITHALYRDFRAAFDTNQTLASKINVYQALIERLPLSHQFLLLYLLDMIAVFAANSQVNRMDVSNLSAVFTPGILSHPVDELNPAGYKLSTRVIEFLVTHQGEFNMPTAARMADRSATVTPQSERQSPSFASPGPGPTRGPIPAYSPQPSHVHTHPNPYKNQTLPPIPRHPPLTLRHSFTGQRTPPEMQNANTTVARADEKAITEAAALKQLVRSAANKDADGKGKGVEGRIDRGLQRSKTVPTRREKWGEDDEIQVIRTGRKDSQGA